MRFGTPLGALVRGFAAGVAGAAAQTYFFNATAKIAPPTPQDVFQPPEEQQKDETATTTVARRAVEHFAQQGPLSNEQKQFGGQIVHYTFGGLWGGLYGLTVETFPSWKGVFGATAFSSIVWMVGDNLILPFFKLSAWPQAYPAKLHAYAWAAHLVYGAGLLLTYRSLSSGAALAGAAYYGARLNRRYGRYVPKPLAKAVVKPAVRFAAKKPVRDFVSAVI